MFAQNVLEHYGTVIGGADANRILCCDDHASWEGRKHLIYGLDDLCAQDLVAHVWFEDWELEGVCHLNAEKLISLARRTIDMDALSIAIQHRSLSSYLPHDLLHVGAYLAERYGTTVYAGIATPAGFWERLLSADDAALREADAHVARAIDVLTDHTDGRLALVGGADHFQGTEGLFFVPRGFEQEDADMREAYVCARVARRGD